MAAMTAAIIGAAAISAYSANQAANSQSDSANRASSMSQAQYNQSRADSAPYRQAGYTALGQLQDPSLNHNFGASDFTQDPGYQFRLEQGQKALQRSAAAQGNLMSGDTLTALTRFNQDQASNEYQNAANRFNTDRSNNVSRLQNIASLGSGQVANLGQLGAANAQTIGNNITSAGNAQAAGQVGMANALTNGVGQYANNQMQQNILDKYSLNGSGGAGGYNSMGAANTAINNSQNMSVPQAYTGRLGTIGGV